MILSRAKKKEKKKTYLRLETQMRLEPLSSPCPPPPPALVGKKIMKTKHVASNRRQLRIMLIPMI